MKQHALLYVSLRPGLAGGARCFGLYILELQVRGGEVRGDEAACGLLESPDWSRRVNPDSREASGNSVAQNR